MLSYLIVVDLLCISDRGKEMASSNKEQIYHEEEITRGRNEADISRCSICLSPLPGVSNSLNKCQQCLDKIESIPTGFQFEIAGAERKEF